MCFGSLEEGDTAPRIPRLTHFANPNPKDHTHDRASCIARSLFVKRSNSPSIIISRSMGHSASSPLRDPARSAAVAASLVVLLAMASASTTATQTSSSVPSAESCGCFVSPSPRTWPSYSAAGPASGVVLAAAATTPGSAVPPPDSRLGRRRASSLLRKPPGTKRGRNKGGGGDRGASDLGYATYGSHYSQYCTSEEHDSNEVADAFDGESSSSPWKWKGFSPREAGAVEGGKGAPAVAKLQGDDHAHAGIDARRTSDGAKRSKRARMLRRIDTGLARLRPHKKRWKDGHGYYPHGDDDNSAEDDKNRLIYEQRKAAWAAKYTSASALRRSFGTNRNRIWGDFDPASTRRLYHTLLPRALLELRGLRDGLLSKDDDDASADNGEGGDANGRGSGTRWKKESEPKSSPTSARITDGGDDDSSYIQQELRELAPLAYQARLAAKKYARERSCLPGRIGSMLYDGYRSWRRYGKWASTGMTWEQVWNKYEDQILQEVMEELEGAEKEEETAGERMPAGEGVVDIGEGLDDEELTARICLRILERSVVTNEAIDRLFLERLTEDDEENEEGGHVNADSAVAAEESRRRKRNRRERQRRRRLAMQADLYAIEREFDDDVRELLRYGNLTTSVGEERRIRRTRRKKGVSGSLFWNRLKDGVPPANDDLEEREQGVAQAASMVAPAHGGGEGRVGDSLGAVQPTSDAAASYESEDIAAAMFSMAEAAPSDASGNDRVGGAVTTIDSDAAGHTEQRRHPLSSLRKLAVHEVFALRILATTKQRITSLQTLPQLGDGGGGGRSEDDAGSSSDAAADRGSGQ